MYCERKRRTLKITHHPSVVSSLARRRRAQQSPFPISPSSVSGWMDERPTEEGIKGTSRSRRVRAPRRARDDVSSRMTRRKITSTRSFILARERATPSSSIPSIRTPRSARPAEMMSTHPSIRAVSRPTRDVAFARAMDANARVKKTKKNDASDSRTSWIDRVDAGYSDATGRPRVDDARARDPSRGRHPRVRPRGRSRGRGPRFFGGRAGGGCMSSRHRSMECRRGWACARTHKCCP